MNDTLKFSQRYPPIVPLNLKSLKSDWNVAQRFMCKSCGQWLNHDSFLTSAKAHCQTLKTLKNDAFCKLIFKERSFELTNLQCFLSSTKGHLSKVTVIVVCILIFCLLIKGRHEKGRWLLLYKFQSSFNTYRSEWLAKNFPRWETCFYFL